MRITGVTITRAQDKADAARVIIVVWNALLSVQGQGGRLVGRTSSANDKTINCSRDDVTDDVFDYWVKVVFCSYFLRCCQ